MRCEGVREAKRFLGGAELPQDNRSLSVDAPTRSHIAENELVHARLDGRRRPILVLHDDPLESFQPCAYSNFARKHKGGCSRRTDRLAEDDK
jgi:hypothetical protein